MQCCSRSDLRFRGWCSVEIEPFTVRLQPPLETARGTLRERKGFLVTVDYQETTGVGEATPLAGWTESYEECRDALGQAERVASELDWGVALAKLDAPAARHGLSLALADALARARERPLYQYLGEDADEDTIVTDVPVNATIGTHETPEETVSKARETVEAGYECLKLKVGTRRLEEDIERVRAVRNAVGDEVQLRVDVNGAWTVEQAKQGIEWLAALDVWYVEQPLATADLEATASLRGRGIDIALDESLAAHDVTTIIETDAADVLVLKPMVVGGPDIAATAAQQCREAGIEPVVSTTFDAVVARTAAVHVAASIPNVLPCGLAPGERMATDIAPDPAPITEGWIHVPQEPGIGVGE